MFLKYDAHTVIAVRAVNMLDLKRLANFLTCDIFFYDHQGAAEYFLCVFFPLQVLGSFFRLPSAQCSEPERSSFFKSRKNKTVLLNKYRTMNPTCFILPFVPTELSVNFFILFYFLNKMAMKARLPFIYESESLPR